MQENLFQNQNTNRSSKQGQLLTFKFQRVKNIYPLWQMKSPAHDDSKDNESIWNGIILWSEKD